MRIRIITYNIRKGLGADGRSNMADALAQALDGQDLDLLMCQEVFHDGRTGASQSTEIAEALGLESYYGANRFRRVGHHGNTTFSRHQVFKVQNHDISTNRVERRGALYLRIGVRGRVLHAINVHLGLNARQRATQIMRVAEIVEACCPETEPVLLAGDFNDWRRSLDAVITRELGFQNAFSSAVDDSVRTWPARRPVFPLDRIYVRNLRSLEVECLRGDPWNELSDHLPLRADLLLP
ncbi:MAG: endonuclease/exonuclease/phosphatase family protein [Proteobacteria bacterium]|nr:endonuclease/exonuclease/phosphatase family protein [Pseudomonadota bacterium]